MKEQKEKPLYDAHACEKNGFISGFESCMSLVVEDGLEDTK